MMNWNCVEELMVIGVTVIVLALILTGRCDDEPTECPECAECPEWLEGR